MANRTKRTPKKYEKFLASLKRTGGNIARACRAEKISRTTAYEWRKADENFKEEWDAAVAEGIDDLEQEARRRALTGLTRKKFDKSGKPIIDPDTEKQYVEKEYSDTLLIFLLKGNRPEKYKERTEVTGKDGKDLIQSITVHVVKTDKPVNNES